MRVPLIASSVLTVLVAGCAQVDQVTAALPIPGQEMPSDDGVCTEERQAFYAAANRAQATEGILEIGGELLKDTFGMFLGGRAGPFEQALTTQFAQAVDSLRSGVLEDQTRIGTFHRTFSSLNDCRTTVARDINADVRRGEMTRDEANARFESMRAASQADIALARRTSDEIEDRTATFRTNVESAKKQARTPAQQQQVAEVEEDLQTNQNELQEVATEIETAEAQQEGVFQVDLSALLLPAASLEARRRRRREEDPVEETLT